METSKRPREDEEAAPVDSSKRHKPSSSSIPYNHIISLLESESDELLLDYDYDYDYDSSQHQDYYLSPLITTLQHEITTTSSPSQHNNQIDDVTPVPPPPPLPKEDDRVESVMRHLLEASDDELGIPNGSQLHEAASTNSVEEFVGGEYNNGSSILCGDDDDEDGLLLWELEDETANYYAFLHSQLFL